MSLTLFSPAKLNLFFRVLHKRPDGFHEIASLYQAISLGDTLTVSLAEQNHLTCNDPRIPTDRSNLIWKALESYCNLTGQRFNVHVHLEKKIPIEAGLGGGSSNAATMLWALNTLSSHPVAQEKLIEIAASFSSDAPFFFSMGTAYCQGRGELIQPVEGIPDTRLWVVKPKEGLSTPLVYKHCRPDEFAKRDPRQLLTDLLMGKPHYFNDLEQAAFSLLPSLHRLKDRLFQLGFSHVTMTGSGTAFFCLGTPLQSQLDGVDFYPISFATRRIGNWYELPHV